jgi:hypothetical protein
MGSSGNRQHHHGHVVCGAELAAGLCKPAQRGPRARGRRPCDLGQQYVAAYVHCYAAQRQGDCALVHSGGSYGENIFCGSTGGGRHGFMGVRESVLCPREQLVRVGPDVCAQHAGGMARLHRHRLRQCRLRQWWHLHNLQLQPAGQLLRTEPVLAANREAIGPTSDFLSCNKSVCAAICIALQKAQTTFLHYLKKLGQPLP